MNSSTETGVMMQDQKPLRSWIDENTGRRVWQMTDSPHGAALGYFRNFRHLPDGRMLLMVRTDQSGPQRSGMAIMDPDSGEIEVFNHSPMYLKLRPSDGRIWQLQRDTGELWTCRMPFVDEAELVATIPLELAERVSDITCDAKTLLLEERFQEKVEAPEGTSELEKLWMHFRRPRSGNISAYDIATGEHRRLVDIDGLCSFHLETSPTDPTLVRYAKDVLECTGQRMFTVRTDGSDDRPIRRQEFGEMITHEFWWADPSLIGYTYQDRRGDTTVAELPWSEYSPVKTRLGIANLQGEEVFLSDPLNSYHSHIFVSRRGDLVTGEGTDGNSFVFAAPFSFDSTKVDYQAMATIHTPYRAMAGQSVHGDFSVDSKWLFYNDTIDGHMQVCRVAVDF